MTNIPTSYKLSDVFGRPAFEVLDTYTQQNLLAGAIPGLTPANRIPLSTGFDQPQFAVVGLNADGELALAVRGSVDPDDDIAVIGVLAHAADETGTSTHGEVLLTGCFNVGADSPLVFDASFTTVDEKVAATAGNPNLVFKAAMGS